MATRNIVPRANGEGSIGTAAKHWGNGYFDELNTEKLVADDVITKGPIVDVRAFGAVGDGVTDDTAAIQAAIDYAQEISIQQNKSVNIFLSKKYLVNTLLINQPGDDGTGNKIIFSGGGTLLIKDDIQLFEPKYPNDFNFSPLEGLVGNLEFNDIIFEAVDADVTIMTGYPFLRCSFTSCLFKNIYHIIFSDIFVQTFHFINCNIQGGDGYLFELNCSEDVVLDGCLIEKRTSGILKQINTTKEYLPQNSNGMRINQFSVLNSTIEEIAQGTNNSLFIIRSAADLLLAGNTFEANARIMDVTPTYGISIKLLSNLFWNSQYSSYSYAYIIVDNSANRNVPLDITAVGNTISYNPLFDITNVKLPTTYGQSVALMSRGESLIKCYGNHIFKMEHEYETSYHAYTEDADNYIDDDQEFYGSMPLQVDTNTNSVFNILKTDRVMNGKFKGLEVSIKDGFPVFRTIQNIQLTANSSSLIDITLPFSVQFSRWLDTNVRDDGVICQKMSTVDGKELKVYVKNLNGSDISTQVAVYFGASTPYYG
jgi:hypothetical protein